MAEQKNTLQASHNKKVFAIETGGFISHCGILAVLAVRIWRQLTRQPRAPPAAALSPPALLSWA